MKLKADCHLKTSHDDCCKFTYRTSENKLLQWFLHTYFGKKISRTVVQSIYCGILYREGS